MFSSSLLIVPLALAATSVARPTEPLVARATSDVLLSDWASHSPPLESYWTFKNRFRSLGCASQQGTDFYTNCCYPLDATQSLADRPAECTPASSWCSASVQAVTPASSAPAPAYTDSNAGNTNNDNSNTGYTPDSVPVPTYTPEPQPQPQPEPQPQPQPDTSNNNNNNNGGNTGGNTGDVYTNGWATYFWQGGNAGACGVYHSDSDLIAALDTRMFGTDYSHQSSWCGRYVRVTNTNNGKQVVVMIQDACPTCDTDTSLDLSYGAFTAIANESEGHVPITWSPV